MLRGIGIREVDSFLFIVDEYETTVLQSLSGYFLTRQKFKLTVCLCLNIENHLFRGSNEEHLRVDAMFCLRQQIGSNKLDIGFLVSNHTDLRRSCGHVDGYVVQTHLLFGCHHILVARTEYLIDLRYAFCTVSHCSDSLNATSLEYLADTGYPSSYQNRRIHLSLTIGRRTEHNLRTTGNLCWGGEHQHRGEEGSCSARDIETYLLDGDTLLPTDHAGLCLHLLCPELLSFMEGVDVIVC